MIDRRLRLGVAAELDPAFEVAGDREADAARRVIRATRVTEANADELTSAAALLAQYQVNIKAAVSATPSAMANLPRGWRQLKAPKATARKRFKKPAS